MNIYDASSALCSCPRAVVVLLPLITCCPALFSRIFFPLFIRCHFRIPHSRFLPIAGSRCERLNHRFSYDFFALHSRITICTILNLSRPISMQLMSNHQITLYFLLASYAAIAFVRWLINDLHKYLLTCKHA